MPMLERHIAVYGAAPRQAVADGGFASREATWLVAGIVPGIERHPLKKIEPNEVELLCLLMRWRAEAIKKGRTITRIVVAFEAGRDGFWLARWLRVRDIESYVIHPTAWLS